MVSSFALSFLVILAATCAGLYGPVHSRLRTLGLTRSLNAVVNRHGEEIRIVNGTRGCEDLHYHQPSNRLFAACQGDDLDQRFRWFPPLANFDDPEALGHGSIYVIDPETFTSKRLVLVGFAGPFVTHGIDIYSPPGDPDSLYVFAVNHLPEPGYMEHGGNAARSQVEIFHHTIGSGEATHLRSVRHPLITTPNDLLITGTRSFYVTNDHYHRAGRARFLETLLYKLTPWSTIVHVDASGEMKGDDASSGVKAAVAMEGLHNNNGLGHGRDQDEIVALSAAGGAVYLLRRNSDGNASEEPSLSLTETIQMEHTLDNPFYYHDPYPHIGRDHSGYVLAGLYKGHLLLDQAKDPHAKEPVQVTLLERLPRDPYFPQSRGSDGWRRRVIFRDDGALVRSASQAVMLPLDPARNAGKKEAWLFVTSFFSQAVVASRIALGEED